MPQTVGARTKNVENDELAGRTTASRAEQLRAGRERLMQLRIRSADVDTAVEETSDMGALLLAAQHEAAAARLQARMAWRTAWICAACVAIGMAAGAWGGLKVYRKLTRDTIDMERLAADARTQRELSGIIAEERDMLRADLTDAREAKARVEGQFMALTGSRPQNSPPADSERAQ
jgi:hypothetical protein